MVERSREENADWLNDGKRGGRSEGSEKKMWKRDERRSHIPRIDTLFDKLSGTIAKRRGRNQKLKRGGELQTVTGVLSHAKSEAYKGSELSMKHDGEGVGGHWPRIAHETCRGGF